MTEIPRQKPDQLLPGFEVLQVLLSKWKLALFIILLSLIAGIIKAQQTTYWWTGKLVVSTISVEEYIGFLPQEVAFNAVVNQYDTAFRTLNASYTSPINEDTALIGDRWPNLGPNQLLDSSTMIWNDPTTMKAVFESARVDPALFRNINAKIYLETPSGRSRKPVDFFKSNINEQFSAGLQFSTSDPSASKAALSGLVVSVNAQVTETLESLFDAKVQTLEEIRKILITQLKTGIETLENAAATGGSEALLVQTFLLKAVLSEVENSNINQTVLGDSNDRSAAHTANSFANYTTNSIIWKQNGSKGNTIIAFVALGFAVFLLIALLWPAVQSLRYKR